MVTQGMSDEEPRTHGEPASGGKRFRVAFSFAGEKRDFVKQVARILAERFGEAAILYDKFHEAEFARARLAYLLPEFYRAQSDLIVAVLCDNYPQKEWCGLEWDAIFSHIKEGHEEHVLLGRFDHVDGKGLFGLSGFIELDDMESELFATRILERLARNEGHSKEYYKTPIIGAAPRTAIPHNLPALQPFFGREDELAKIADALEPESRTWGAIIDGPGGMGKTSLAVRAAHACTPAQFKKIAFISLKSRELDDDGVRDLSGFLISGLAELLNELARELGHPDITKASENERPRMLLDALRDTRTLLILDNLESLLKKERDTVFTFVKKLPPDCKAILTSRVRLGSGAEELILEKLSQEAALATLADLAASNSDLAKTSEAERLVLYRETGGKPLLLRWTAGQIGRGHCITFTDAIEHLRSCPEGNDPLEFIFGDLVGDFNVEESKVLCALTYFTLPAAAKDIAALTNPLTTEEQDFIEFEYWNEKDDYEVHERGHPAERDLTDAEILHALKSLINRSLVVPNGEFTTFTLVPLVADFLRKAKPEIVAETGDRLEKRAYALIVENGDQNYDRFPVLGAAWPTVVAALPRFLAGDNERLQALCSSLPIFLNFTGRWDEWLALSCDAESRAVAAGDFHSAGVRAYEAGWVHNLRGQSQDVLACADRAGEHWREAKAGAREQAEAIRLRGIGYFLAKDYHTAIAAYREALELDCALDSESSDVAGGLSSLADAEMKSGDLEAAERDYREALRIYRAVRNQEGVALCLGNLAELALEREDWTGGEGLAREALPLSEKIGRQEAIANTCGWLAYALARQGRKSEALPLARRAVEILDHLGSRGIAWARDVLAMCEG
jgi:tetratricopeptide (TPR) repeat protein